MSKKQTEFDRYNRKKRLEREAEAQKRRSNYDDFYLNEKKRTKCKHVSNNYIKKQGKYLENLDNEFDYA